MGLSANNYEPNNKIIGANYIGQLLIENQSRNEGSNSTRDRLFSPQDSDRRSYYQNMSINSSAMQVHR